MGHPSRPDDVALARAHARFGWWASLGAAATTLVTFAVAIGTPPLSGPLCKAGCFAYPYLDVASRFPRDYYWLFFALVATVLFVAFVIALAERARPERRPLATLGLVLAAMAGLTLLGDYSLQLAVVQPSLLASEPDGISLLNQYNPHGVFIGLEELGYVLMSASLGVAGTAMRVETRLEKAARALFVGGLGVCLLALVGFAARYGHAREYRFEITAISIGWLTVIIGAFMMAVVYRRALRRPEREQLRRAIATGDDHGHASAAGVLAPRET